MAAEAHQEAEVDHLVVEEEDLHAEAGAVLVEDEEVEAAVEEEEGVQEVVEVQEVALAPEQRSSLSHIRDLRACMYSVVKMMHSAQRI